MLYILQPFLPFFAQGVIRDINRILPELEKVEPHFEGHLRRTCFYAFHFGKKLALGEEEIRLLYSATFFHDIGKISIPAGILNKCGPLTREEFRIMKSHPELGARICRRMGLSEELAGLVGAHHEKIDGTGYPHGLKGDLISPLARVLAVIEIYDALRSERCYKEPFLLTKSLEVLASEAANGKLDRHVVQDFSRFAGELTVEPEGITPELFEEDLNLNRKGAPRAFSAGALTGGGSPLMILVVEDDPDLRELNELALSKSGYNVVSATDAKEALEKLDRESIDIALLDIMLPDMNGFELCRKIRENPRLNDIHIIFLSALGRSEDKVKGFEAGGNDYIAKPFFLPELLARVKTGEKLIRQRRELERLASRDHLTGLYNRRFFVEMFGEQFERSKRYGRPLSILMIDIDNFKSVNDGHGHDVGDLVLKKIAGVLRARTRKSDIQVRYGGEEFIVVLSEIGLEGAIQAGLKLCQEIKKLVFTTPSSPFSVTVSIGVASYQEKSYAGWEEMLKDADLALYEAKRSGKDCVRTPCDYGAERP
ncbi:MAG: diguanylate cyclase [Deltaproteobacteria bacterium]|nr:diguanylate cyclase [Deltaproteobacteria bacterium]